MRGQHFATPKFLHFQMVDSKPIVQQIEKFHSICCDLSSEGISLCNTFIVNYLIENLSASWVNFMTYLRRNQGRLKSLDDILSKIKFEDLNKNLMKNQLCSIPHGS